MLYLLSRKKLAIIKTTSIKKGIFSPTLHKKTPYWLKRKKKDYSSSSPTQIPINLFFFRLLPQQLHHPPSVAAFTNTFPHHRALLPKTSPHQTLLWNPHPIAAPTPSQPRLSSFYNFPPSSPSSLSSSYAVHYQYNLRNRCLHYFTGKTIQHHKQPSFKPIVNNPQQSSVSSHTAARVLQPPKTLHYTK